MRRGGGAAADLVIELSRHVRLPQDLPQERVFVLRRLEVVLGAPLQYLKPVRIVRGVLLQSQPDSLVVLGDEAEPHGEHSAVSHEALLHFLVGNDVATLGA